VVHLMHHPGFKHAEDSACCTKMGRSRLFRFTLREVVHQVHHFAFCAVAHPSPRAPAIGSRTFVLQRRPMPPAASGPLRVALLTVGALLGFAGNSLLCRLALLDRAIDADSFTALRLGSGALMLAALARFSRSSPLRAAPSTGSWPAALALAGYAVFFSHAYLRLGAGVGALVLFGTVQVTMIGLATVRGGRPGPFEWVGLLLGAGGLVALTLPGAGAPDLVGVGLMAVAGNAWAGYSLLGRGVTDPLGATAGNFLRSVPLFLPVLALPALQQSLSWSSKGAALAVASGAVASGLAYSLWHAALRHLGATRAAIVQLSVPALAAFGGVLMLGEVLTVRTVAAGGASPCWEWRWRCPGRLRPGRPDDRPAACLVPGFAGRSPPGPTAHICRGWERPPER
jgi:drug/metabolite transporter (DMT)-like permease